MRMWDQEREDPRAFCDMGVELFAVVPGTKNRYFVSNLGRVVSNAQGVLKDVRSTPIGTGYATVGIYYDVGGRPTTQTVHRLVLRVFDGQPPSSEHTDVRHLDCDKGNNKLSNLRYGTRSENMKDVWAQRRSGKPAPVTNRTTSRSWYDLDDRLVSVSLGLYREGKITGADLQRLLNVSQEAVQGILEKPERWLEGMEPVTRKKRRSPTRIQEILRLVHEGRTRQEVNDLLGEHLTMSDFNYYRDYRPKLKRRLD